MDVNSILFAEARQLDHSVYTNGDADAKLRMSLLGQMYMADWKHLMVTAGKAYRMSIGTITAGDDITMVGNGTVVNLDQPFGVVAVDAGLSLIPIEVEISGDSDTDAAEDEVDFLMTADRTQAEAAGATATVEVPDNLLDGGPAFGGRAYSVVTADITDPVHSDVLAFKTWNVLLVAAEAGGSFRESLHYQKEFGYPTILRGPCQILMYFAGTVATTGIGSLTFGAVPSSWFPVE